MVLVALFTLAMYALAKTLPSLFLSALWVKGFAVVFIGVGAGMAVLGVLAFRKANTTVDPRVPQQSVSLVVSGIYRYSRNPMYLGFLLWLIGLACYLLSIAAFSLLPLFVWYMNRFQIKPEERFLQQKFGAEYLSYMRQVRRWL